MYHKSYFSICRLHTHYIEIAFLCLYNWLYAYILNIFHYLIFMSKNVNVSIYKNLSINYAVK